MIVLLCAALALAVDGRAVGGHAFAIPSAVESPFTTTYLTVRQGVGYLQVPRVAIEGWDSRFTLRLAGIVETMELQARLSPNVALYGGLTGELVSGIDPDSAFFLGARGGFVGEAGARFAVAEWRRSLLGARVFGRTRRGVGLEPSALVDAVLDNREQTLSDVLRGRYSKYVLRSERSSVLGVGLAWAWAIAPSVGLQSSYALSAGPSVGEVLVDDREVEVRSTMVTQSAGLAVDVDLPPAPAAVQLELRNRLDGEGSIESHVDPALVNRIFVATQLLYTGRDDLQLSLGLTGLLPTGRGRTDRFYTAELTLRYFFEPHRQRR